PAAIIGASPGTLGTARAQYHLRQVGVFLDLHFLNKPEVMIGSAAERFDTDGKLKDEKTAEHIRKLMDSLHRWTAKLTA
ncbi:NAD(P)H-dependent oxidoreductase, partial [Acinetobacter baumannii]